MQCKSSFCIVRDFLLLLCLSTACHALVPTAAPELSCYICNDCATVTANTPKELCNAEFFSTSASPTTMLSTMTTTERPTTMPATTELSTPADTSTDSSTDSSTDTSTETSTDSSTDISTDTSTDTTTHNSTESDSSSSSTTQLDSSSTTEHYESTSTTEAPDTTPRTTTMPTPPTIGPESTSTAIPTPPNPGTVVVPANDQLAVASTKLLRQRRQALQEDYTYHCYSVQKSENGLMVTDRSCARVTTNESVCGQLTEQNPGSSLSKCNPCSTSLCNGSSALGVSVLAVVVGVLAALLRSN